MSATLLASACPAPPVIGTVYYASSKYASGASVPPYSGFTTGMTTVTSATLNQNLALNALLGRYGAGVYAVAYGLTVASTSGLNISVNPGHALIDGPVEKDTTFTVNVTDNIARFWVWLKQDGTTVVQNNTTSKPAGNCVLLFSGVSSAGSITSTDTSGVCYLQNGDLWRLTADTGAPSDLPDSTWRGYTKTSAGLFYWDGTLWQSVGNTYMIVTGAKSDANYTQTQTEYWVKRYKAAWTGWTTGRNLVVPLTNNWEQWITNSTGQTLTAIGASGTGIAIASTKTALVASDGTNIIRLSLDA